MTATREPTVSVLIPWHGDDQHRRQALGVVERFYQECFPLWELCVAEQLTEPFSCSATLNQGLLDTNGEIVVINSADSICPPQQVAAAVQLAANEPTLVYCYRHYLRLSRLATAKRATDWRHLLAFQGSDVEWGMVDALSNGCVAIQRSHCPPFDEGFEGWGWEDIEWVMRCARLGKIGRVEGPLVHMWHPPTEGQDPDRDERNRQRYIELSSRPKVELS